ncbi:hypothetical protein [Janthinobacterium sp. MDT1-19]|uniref:hypothetical protein n=1 Tax=Janthinobacterium sp. MDT1-19 TaxID=1259339 RepID=UPI003F20DAE5
MAIGLAVVERGAFVPASMRGRRAVGRYAAGVDQVRVMRTGQLENKGKHEASRQ